MLTYKDVFNKQVLKYFFSLYSIQYCILTYFLFNSAAKFDHERGGRTDGREDDHREMGGHGEGRTNRRVQGHCVGQLQQGTDNQRVQ